jgi:DNA polymerase I-like protein with 3'-5' exonuclease and polymerase domains
MEIIRISSPNTPQAAELKELMAGRDRLGFDVETDCSDPDRIGDIVCWQVSDGKRCFVVEARGWPVTEPSVAAWIADPTARKAIHYATFEAAALDRYGLVVRGITDTYVLAVLLTAGADPAQMHAIGLSGHSLAALVEQGWGVRLDKSLQTSFRKGLPLTRAQVDYAALDAYWALHLAEALEKQVAKAGLTQVADLEQRVAQIAARMSRVGVPVDAEKWWQLCGAAANKAAMSVKKVVEALGVPTDLFGEHPGFLVDSNAQVGSALVAAGVLLETTSDGSFVLDEPALRKIDHPAAKALLEYRHAKKVADWSAAPTAGRIYPTWKAIGAATGRMSASSPNVMAIPRPLTEAVGNADGIDRLLVAADYRNQELYVLADLSGDEQLIAALTKGDDPYAAVSEAIGVPRKVAKVATLAVAYGASAKEVGVIVGGDSSEGAALRRSLQRAFPRAMSFCRSPRAEELRAGWRRRLLLDRQRGAFVGNTPIQATAATMTKLAMVRACRSIVDMGGEFVLAIHDELVVDVPAEHADQAAAALRKAMGDAGAEVAARPSLAPPARAGVGRNLAQARASGT